MSDPSINSFGSALGISIASYSTSSTSTGAGGGGGPPQEGLDTAPLCGSVETARAAAVADSPPISKAEEDGGSAVAEVTQQASTRRVAFAFWAPNAISVRVAGNFCEEGLAMFKEADTDVFFTEALLPPRFAGDLIYNFFCDGKLQDLSPSVAHSSVEGNFLAAARLNGEGPIAAGEAAAQVLEERAVTRERDLALRDIHSAVDAWESAIKARFRAAQTAHCNESVVATFSAANRAADMASSRMLDAINIYARMYGAVPPSEDQ
jgi:hypothetical protein